MDVRQKVAEQIGSLILTNIELAAQCAKLDAEAKELRAAAEAADKTPESDG